MIQWAKMELNKIYLGDTSETLKEFPSAFFDITVTSPPYNKMGVKGGLVDEVKYKNTSDVRNEQEYQVDQTSVLAELWRVTKPGGHIFYNHKIRWVEGKMIHPLEWVSLTAWALRQEIIWDRQIAGQLRGWRFWQTEERIYWMQKGITKGHELASKHAKLGSIWKIRPETRFQEHPAPFPVAIPTRCIYSIADDQRGLNILDPYCGIGSTLVAAKVLQHNYVGIDCCAEYIKLAEERLQDPHEIDHVQWETKLHVVEETYQQKKTKRDIKQSHTILP